MDIFLKGMRNQDTNFRKNSDLAKIEENGDEDAAEGFLIEKELTRLVIGIDFGTTYSGKYFL